jgi:Dyp-type peroxidase family
MNARADMQGNILRGYASHSHTAYVFTQITDPLAARRLLAKLAPRIANEDDWESRPASRLNVAFTYAGLKCLDVPLDSFTPFADFQAGMYERARAALGDLGDNDPQHWSAELSHRAHVLFTIYGHDEGVRARELELMHGELAAGGMEAVYIQLADSRHGSREHFGFRDGFSEPVLADTSRDRRSTRGEGAQRSRWRLGGESWRPVALGEFVLGHKDEDGVVPGHGDHLLRNGTFMVWRKLEQHVDAFEEWIGAQTGGDPAAAAVLKARIVGRWPDGASLIRRPPGAGGPGAGRSPAGDGSVASAPDRATQRPEINDFVYGSDPDGLRCPLGAHVRRAYPRDALGYRTERTRRNRIIRRGVPYSEDQPAPAPPRRGLIFVCFNASIARQFEQIQRNWLTGGDAFGLSGDRDFLIGGLDHAGDTTRMTIQGDRAEPPQFLTRDRQFVTVRGGYYLFVPGLEALRRMIEHR